MNHYPVMTEEIIQYLAVRPDGIYADVTAGLGGHTEAIAGRLSTGRVIANDRDAESLERARKRLEPWKERALFVHGRFSELEARLAEMGIARLDGLLADLGSSFYQLTAPERGFSLMSDGPLDMRMDRSRGRTAADLINHIAEPDLADLLFHYGGERRARRVARAIVRARPIRTTRQLAQVVEAAVPRTKSRLHRSTKTFLALRIAVNEEIEELDALLEALPRLVGSGGRVVFITFHSVEDRRVKLAFRALAQSGKASLLTKHVVRPTREEVRENPPSRSAKLRALEMN